MSIYTTEFTLFDPDSPVIRTTPVPYSPDDRGTTALDFLF
jgi:hypothetical protein